MQFTKEKQREIPTQKSTSPYDSTDFAEKSVKAKKG